MAINCFSPLNEASSKNATLPSHFFLNLSERLADSKKSHISLEHLRCFNPSKIGVIPQQSHGNL